MTDVRLYNTPDGGEIDIVNGNFDLNDGLETAVYLSMFGGNADDDGSDATSKNQWWGNLGEEEVRQYRGETAAALRGTPATPANLILIREAIENDLAWLVDTEIALAVVVTLSIPARNRLMINITLHIGENEYSLQFPTVWGTGTQ